MKSSCDNINKYKGIDIMMSAYYSDIILCVFYPENHRNQCSILQASFYQNTHKNCFISHLGADIITSDIITIRSKDITQLLHRDQYLISIKHEFNDIDVMMSEHIITSIKSKNN